VAKFSQTEDLFTALLIVGKNSKDDWDWSVVDTAPRFPLPPLPPLALLLPLPPLPPLVEALLNARAMNIYIEKEVGRLSLYSYGIFYILIKSRPQDIHSLVKRWTQLSALSYFWSRISGKKKKKTWSALHLWMGS
jgi:hypothetical protein